VKGVPCIAAVLAALVLSGCVPTKPVPQGYSREQLRTMLEKRVDQFWVNLELEGVVERPEIEFELQADPARAYVTCAADVEAFANGWMGSDGADGPTMRPLDGAFDIASRLAAYECFAANPYYEGWEPPRTEAERQFLTAHAEQYLAPCMAAAWVELNGPVDTTGHAYDFGSTPYDLIQTETERERVILACGDPYGGLSLPGQR